MVYPAPDLLLADRHTVQLHPAWVDGADVNGFNRLLNRTRQHPHSTYSQCEPYQRLLAEAV